MRILLVEDEIINAMLTTQLLQQMKHEVMHVDNGLKAVELFEQHFYFDLVLMDLNLPVMNGLDATLSILKICKMPPPIIAFTATDSSNIVNDCLKVGMFDVLIKPLTEVSFSALLNKINYVDPARIYIDLAYLEEIACGNADNVVIMFNRTLMSITERLKQIHKALEINDYSVVSECAHNLRTLFKIIGDKSNEELMKNAEQMFKKMNVSDEMLNQLFAFKKLFIYKENTQINYIDLFD